MLNINRFERPDLEGVIDITTREQLNYQEYKFINNQKLFTTFENRLESNLQDPNSLSFVIKQNNQVLAYINIQEDLFDSLHFSLKCFRVLEYHVSNKANVHKIVLYMIQSIILYLKNHYKNGYLFIGLSNNHPSMQAIFNGLTKAGLQYIHTLLTFSQHKTNHIVKNERSNKLQGLNIREAKKEDLSYLEEIAYTSFKYSRFHMDPLLDNERASCLLKNSIRNSLLEGFVDKIFVAEYEQDVVGYYSGKKRFDSVLNFSIGEAVISAVSNEARGKGVFQHLNNSMLEWFSENTDFAEMGTYLVNTPVHKTWISNGLNLIKGTHQFSTLF